MTLAPWIHVRAHEPVKTWSEFAKDSWWNNQWLKIILAVIVPSEQAMFISLRQFQIPTIRVIVFDIFQIMFWRFNVEYNMYRPWDTIHMENMLRGRYGGWVLKL